MAFRAAVYRHMMTLASVAIALCCAACANPQMERNLQRRGENLNKTLGWAAESEQHRPDKLDKTARVIEWQIEHDNQKAFVENPATARKWTQDAFDRWEERQPAFHKGILDELDGNLEHLEQTIPKLID